MDTPNPRGAAIGDLRVNLSFVLGTGRCGSTLVHDVLARHQDIGFVSNVDDNLAALDLMGRWNNVLYRRVPPRFTQKGRVRYAPSEAYRLLDRQVSPMLSDPNRDLTADDVTPWLARRFGRFFERRYVAQGRPIFVHKFTGWPRVGFIASVFPELSVINVIRDGRAVANSWLQMPWWRGYRGPEEWHWGPLRPEHRDQWESTDQSFVALAGIGWMMLMEAFERSRRLVGPQRWLDVRYEDVVADPRGQFGRLLGFLGVEWDREFERAFRRYDFSTSRREAFRQDLTSEQLILLEKITGPLLAQHGYS